MVFEIWKDVPGFEGTYQVSNFGNVKSIDRLIVNEFGVSYIKKGSIRKAYLNNKGYLSISVWDKDKKKSKHIRVHVLVAMAFLSHKSCNMDMVVDHIDNNKLNNRLENIQIISQRENCSKDKKEKSSKYTGVSFDKSRRKWCASIYVNGKSKNIGRFNCELSALVAYNKNAKKLSNERVL